MLQLLKDIEWAETPLIANPQDAGWNETVSWALGRSPYLLQWIASSPWLRSTVLSVFQTSYQHTPERLQGIAIMVTSQENACRYCYGVARASLASMGIEESAIQEIERDSKLSGADEKERALIRFCRNLARSSPRPAKEQREALEALGYDPRMLVELAFHVSMWCFVNRVATFLAVPLEEGRRADDSGALARLARRCFALLSRSTRSSSTADRVPHRESDFAPLVAALRGLSVAQLLESAVQAGFGATRLSRRTKSLMVAVLARALQCPVCETEARTMAIGEGVPEQAVEEVLTTLSSPLLSESERQLIAWTRETVHFETKTIQKRTMELRESIGEELTVEAIGIAALGNAMVRMGMLSQ
jgi:alkylhydroperoxidase family enzyme